jgi:LmbE family N-acetylglucosaminyl deacetylase
MTFHIPTADIFIPDNAALPEALSRTSHLVIGAHQDDIEFGAFHAVAECFQNSAKWLCGVICTDGAGSCRTGPYAGCSNEEMKRIRIAEQRKAATIGEYGAMIQLGYPSAALKDSSDSRCVEDLLSILQATKPDVVFVHNPADKHDTHVAVFLRSIAALRQLPASTLPSRVLGYEAWRDLDWLIDSDKIALGMSERPNLQAALNGVFDSQISGGKRYDLAAMGRRLAHATFFSSHSADTETGLAFAMDLTPLITNSSLSIAEFTAAHVDRLRKDVLERLGRFT